MRFFSRKKKTSEEELAAALIRTAISIIGNRGWAQEVLEDENGGVCLVGAMERTMPAPGTRDYVIANIALKVAYAELQSKLEERRTNVGNLIAFNDHPQTRKKDVILLMIDAAHSLEEKK